MESVENHRAEGLLKFFQESLGNTKNWTPEKVQRKLLLKKSTVMKSKQKSIKGTLDLCEEARFKEALKNGVSFIACVQTRNLSACDAEQEGDIARFLDNDHPDQFIWCVCRSHPNPIRFGSTDYCKEMVEIPDLNFGSDRHNQLKVKCPIDDILVVLVMEEKYEISILYNQDYIKPIKHRTNYIMKPKIAQFFKTSNSSNQNRTNKENFDPNQPSTSGLNSQQFTKKNLSQNTGTSGGSLNQPTLCSSQTPTSISSQTPSSISSETPLSISSETPLTNSTTIAESIISSQSQSSLEKEIDRKESSDEYEDDGDCSKKYTKKIVFRNTHAEITSNGITQRIQIASKKQYPEMTSQVGFQIENICR